MCRKEHVFSKTRNSKSGPLSQKSLEIVIPPTQSGLMTRQEKTTNEIPLLAKMEQRWPGGGWAIRPGPDPANRASKREGLARIGKQALKEISEKRSLSKEREGGGAPGDAESVPGGAGNVPDDAKIVPGGAGNAPGGTGKLKVGNFK